MANEISYFVPTLGSGAAIDFRLKTNSFKAQFKLGTIAKSNLTLQTMALLALNSGYGATSSELFGLPPLLWWTELQAYLKARLALTDSLLSTTGGVITSSFPLKRLEKTEQGDMSYMVGMLFCRVAAEEWVNQYVAGATITKFWHLSVAENSAASLSFVTSKGGKRVLKPDFIFELSSGDWYTIEAKGTFDNRRWSLLKPGLKQASKIQNITYWDHSSKPSPIFKTEKIKGYACTLTYFDKKNELQVTYVDPVVRMDRTSLALVKEFAQLVRYEQAFIQYHMLSEPILEKKPSWMNILDGANWQIMFRNPDPTISIYVGMPKLMEDLRQHLRLALSTLRIVVPMISCLLGNTTDSNAIEDAKKKCLNELESHKNEEIEEYRGTWERAVAFINHTLLNNESAQQQAETMLNKLIRTNFLPRLNGGSKLNILSLIKQLEVAQSRTKQYTELTASLKQQKSPAYGLKISMSDHGLLVLSGQWTSETKRIAKTVKI